RTADEPDAGTRHQGAARAASPTDRPRGHTRPRAGRRRGDHRRDHLVHGGCRPRDDLAARAAGLGQRADGGGHMTSQPVRYRLDSDDDDPRSAERGLASLVLTIVELLRQLMERQAIRRVEDGTVTDEQAENLGYNLMLLDERMTELTEKFGLTREDL